MSERDGSTLQISNRRAFIGGSDARIIMGDDENALVRLWREKRGDVEPEDPSRIAPTVDAAKTFVGPVQGIHTQFVAALAGHPPRPIPVNPHALDLEDRTDHLRHVLRALSGYLVATLDDTAQNVPGGLDLRQIDALLCDLVSEVTGTLQHAADALPGRRS